MVYFFALSGIFTENRAKIYCFAKEMVYQYEISNQVYIAQQFGKNARF